MSTRQQREWTGLRIRQYRRDAALTQTALAKAVVAKSKGALTVDQSSVSNWERGVAEVSLRYRRVLAAVLDCPMDILFEAPPDGWRESREAA